MYARVLYVVLATSVAFTGSARAGETTKRVFDGVILTTRTTSTPNVIHILTVDMTTPGVSLGATASSARKTKTSTFATASGAAAAINGDLFSFTE